VEPHEKRQDREAKKTKLRDVGDVELAKPLALLLFGLFGVEMKAGSRGFGHTSS
jgi:hypothetical protein